MIYWDDNYLCDRGFLINLKSRTDRLERAILELDKAKLTGVERFNAVKVEDPQFTKYGCTQSHLEIAKLQVENKWDYVLYIEDDIMLDVFYSFDLVDKKFDYKKIVKNIVDDFNTLKPDVLWLGTRINKPSTKVTQHIVKPSGTIMSQAYIGSLKFANFVVKHLQYKNSNYFSYNYAIDFFMTQLMEKDCWQIADSTLEGREFVFNNDINILATVPLIFNQGPSYSDLTDNYTDYTNFIRDCYYHNVNIKALDITPYYE